MTFLRTPVFCSLLLCFCFSQGERHDVFMVLLSESEDERNLSPPKAAAERRESWTFAPSHQSFLLLGFCL